MRCPKCQFENPADTFYCGKCGTKLYLRNRISVSKTMTLETTGEELPRGAVFIGRYEITEYI